VAGRGFRVTIEGLEEMGADLSRLSHPGLRNAIRSSLRGKGGEALALEMKQRAPERSGTLRKGIGVHGSAATGDDVEVGYLGALAAGSGIAGARDQRGAWVESGTAPHVIEPRNGGSLAFNGGRFERVNHPGQKGQRVAAKSLRAAEWEVMADIVDEINKVTGGSIT